jgi:hypothetical protein
MISNDVWTITYLGIFSRLVGHKSINKCVGGGLHNHASERAVEKVGIILDRLLESIGSEIGDDIEVIIRL